LHILETERLVLRHLGPTDASFVLELLNDPDWLRYIGDRGVRTAEQAIDYIEAGPATMYARYGFGLYLTELKNTREPIGICGLIQRPFLENVDLGFAFLARYRGAGYAHHYAHATLGLGRVVAITTPDNERSARLLQKLGFHFEQIMTYPGETDALWLFACQLSSVDPAIVP
jgi:RimJ/RimL family protein N-acetyltransferase